MAQDKEINIHEEIVKRISEQLEDSRTAHDKVWAENKKLKVEVEQLKIENTLMLNQIEAAVYGDEDETAATVLKETFEKRVEQMREEEVWTFEPAITAPELLKAKADMRND